ncbi:MAG: cation:proton antiporter subunit C [Firmicutes bacterium]|jgi:multicomponent Na+:H+ antiporter subunit C|nr:cation:proton antiporter subunit C [Bacillota bacterium]MBQ1580835.1 cation:proton antiporter subunit C [Bacillota bacterium]MBQ2147491.1 cation:proton antiporter subunit C [Bacillota bacterium]MBQ2218416.1 cation:proton antiporter subunit C [Bacillota bacterium]MBQ4005111.1 cation:proton antiporter subunit C [Bacillota bacterium]
MSVFFANLPEYAAMILFGIGLSNLMLAKNLVKKIIGLNIMDTSVYLFLAAKGYVENSVAPIVSASDLGHIEHTLYTNPVPAGLVLTGIVVSVSVTAVLLSLIVRLNEEFHTLDIDEIIHILRKRDREDLK